jgi:probable HAF family extracellular repeat protein
MAPPSLPPNAASTDFEEAGMSTGSTMLRAVLSKPSRVPSCLGGLLLAALLPCGSALADPLYAVTALAAAGSSGTGINAAGAVVGQFANGGGSHGFVYGAGGFLDLGTLGGAGSAANGINDHGAVVGWADNGSGQRRAFLYDGGVMSDLGTLGGAGSTAWAIDNSGTIIGSASTGQEELPYFQQAFRYAGGSMQGLGTLSGGLGSTAYAINAHGLIAGFSYEGPITVPEYPSHATTFAGGAVTEIAPLDNGLVFGINDAGQMVGRYGFTTGSRGFVFANGVATELGLLDPVFGSGQGTDINNLGQIVGASMVQIGEFQSGYHGVLYGLDGTPTDLNALIDPASGWEIVDAASINDAGQIAGTACKGGECFAVRLDLVPAVPEPGSWAMFAGGLLLFGMRGRRPVWRAGGRSQAR